jgi:hypothetical protein
MGSSRSATAPAVTRRQQLLLLLIGLLVVSPQCVGANLFKRGKKKAPAKAIESTSESSDAALAEQPTEQVCDHLARSLVKANDEKAAAIAEREEALAKIVTSEERIAELEQVGADFFVVAHY